MARIRSQQALTVLCVLLACGRQLPTGITDADVIRLRIQQGIAGKAAARWGDCTQGCFAYVPSVCTVEAPQATLFVLPADELVRGQDWNGDAGACTMGGNLSRFSGVPLTGAAQRSVASAALVAGEYAIALDAGEYTVVIADPNGCATCLTVAERDGGLFCVSVQVGVGEVTKYDVFLDKGLE